MIATTPNAAERTALNETGEIVGYPDQVSESGGRGYFRQLLDHAFIRTLADALDDSVSPSAWTPAETFDHLEPMTDALLANRASWADVPRQQIGRWIDYTLFYVGKQDPPGAGR